MKQNRFKSKVAWATLGTAIGMVLIAFDVITPSQSEAINTAITAILGVCTAFGIFNNPTDKENL